MGHEDVFGGILLGVFFVLGGGIPRGETHLIF